MVVVKKVFAAFVLLLVCTALFFALPSVRPSAWANSTNVVQYEASSPLADLKQLDAKVFNVNNYPPNSSGTIGMVLLMEYGFSAFEAKSNDFGLYVYIYNPRGWVLAERDNSHRIQMTVNGVTADFNRYNLRYCSKSTEANFEGLFYKFKVIDREYGALPKIFDRVKGNGNARQYEVSGMTVVKQGDAVGSEYAVAKSFVFSGYAKGLGVNALADSTLTWSYGEIETISLDVKNVFYRTGVSNLGVGHQNEINSVYFAVDDNMIEKYGKLQRIKADWYEYKTKEIVVTNHADFYNKAIGYMGYNIPAGTHNNGVGYAVARELSISPDPTNPFDVLITAHWSWNAGFMIRNHPIATIAQRMNGIPYLYYLLKTDKIIEKGAPYDGGITGANSSLAQYILSYNAGTATGYLPAGGSYNVHEELFLPTVDSGRTRGQNTVEIDADTNVFDILSYNDNSPNFWDKVRDFGFWNVVSKNPDRVPELGESYADVPPIIAVKAADLVGSDEVVSKKLLIRAEDLPALRSYLAAPANWGKTVFLFRFALTDYYADWLSIVTQYGTNEGYSSIIGQQAYLAQLTTFWDFKIISLTFKDEQDNLKVIPVVSDPLNIINDPSAPIHEPDDKLDLSYLWNDLLGNIWKLLGLILIVALVIIFFPTIVKLIVWLIALPFKIIGGIVKAVKKKE